MEDASRRVSDDAGTQIEILRRLWTSDDANLAKKRAMVDFFACLVNVTHVDLLHLPANHTLDLRRDASVVLVGNGPLHTSWSETIDAFDVVVRFNDHVLTPWHGNRTDVHIVNKHAVQRDDHAMLVPMDCDDLQFNANAFHAQTQPTIGVHSSLMRQVCSKWNPSRGFLAINLFWVLYGRVTVVGFGGVGHHTSSLVDLTYHAGYHDVHNEHVAIREMIEQGRVRSLEKIEDR